MLEEAIQRAQILLNQGRNAEAEKIMQDILNEQPDNPLVLSFLAEIKLRLDQYDAATVYVDAALVLSPDAGFIYYIKARIAIQKEEYDNAEKNLEEAIKFDPEDPDFFATFASVKLARKQYQEALDLSNQALELDAEHILALNNRSRALLKLNKKEESFFTIEGALREDPNNPYTHANYGWGLLEKENHKKALEHFREALKVAPDMEMARAGMVEALKASNFFYRMFLKYSFWMGNLTKQYQWGLIIGVYFASRGLNALAASSAALRPYLIPVIILVTLFAFSTWVMNPVSNLFFRLSRYGRYMLKNKEIISSNFVGISLLIFILGIASFFLLHDIRYLAIAVFGFTMMVPLGVMFSPAKYRNAFIYYAAAMALVGVISIATGFLTGEVFNTYTSVYLFGFIAFQWGANFLMISQSNK